MFLCLKIGHAIQNSILIGNMMVNDWILRIFQKNPYFFWGGGSGGRGEESEENSLGSSTQEEHD